MKLNPQRIAAWLLSLFILVVVLGAICMVYFSYRESHPLNDKVRIESFTWPGDSAGKEIEVTYTAADGTTSKARFSTLGSALQDLERNGWKLKTSLGITTVISAAKRSAPGVYVSVGSPARRF